MRVTGLENKMLDRSAVENKADAEYHRCPTGYSVDLEARVRTRRDAGPVELLEITMYRRSPSDCSASAFHATAQTVVVQAIYAEHLCSQIRLAVGLAA